MKAVQTYVRAIKQWCLARRDFLFWSVVALIAAVAVAMTLPQIGQQQLGFDEGWNLQAPYELVHEGKYASFGAVFDGQTKVFDPYLSTGPAVSLPISAVFAVFGTGVEQARVVMLAFYVAAIALLAWYAYDRTKSFYALLAPLVLFLVTSSGVLFRIEVLGEIPAVVYALASFIAWRRGTYWLAGLFAALAAFSKLIMLQLIAAGGVCFVIWLIRRRKEWRPVAKRGLQWALGAGIPLVLWEVVRFVQLGGSPGAYFQNLKEFVRVFRVNGSGIGDSGTVLTLANKVELLLGNITIPRALMIAGIVAMVIGLVLGYKKLRVAISDNLYGLALIGIYCVWWFGVSNGGYARYTLPLFLIGWAVLLHMFLRALPDKPPKKRWLGWGLKTVLAIVVVCGVWQLNMPPRLVTSEAPLSEQKQVAAALRAAKPERLVHFGWWQNPEILFLSGMHSQEIGYVKSGEPYQLLLSPAIRAIEPADYRSALLTLCNGGTIFRTPGYILCHGVKP